MGLFQAGVNVERYLAKTTHHASSSKAFFAGVNVDCLLDHAGWVNISSFIMHYNLPIEKANLSKLPASVKSQFALSSNGKPFLA